jgi:hypothetical protein
MVLCRVTFMVSIKCEPKADNALPLPNICLKYHALNSHREPNLVFGGLEGKIGKWLKVWNAFLLLNIKNIQERISFKIIQMLLANEILLPHLLITV